MARTRAVLAGVLALGLTGAAWIGFHEAPASTTSVVAHVPVTSTTSTTVVVPTTTTTSPPAPVTVPRPPKPPRASRGDHQRPVATTVAPEPVVAAPEAPEAPGDECHVRGYKSKAQSDACWRPYVALYNWPVERMLSILHCESKGDEWAVNGKHNGLLQIANSNTLGNGPANIEHGYGVYSSAIKRGDRGTKPWEQCGG